MNLDLREIKEREKEDNYGKAKKTTTGRQKAGGVDSERSNKLFENSRNDSDLGFDRLVSPRTAAELLDVSAKFVYECIARREIVAERVGGRLRRIRLSALEAWLATQRKGV